ncbi:MAG: hypothetical protein AB8H79_09890 [Myxococcota bacterium]
MTRLLLSLLLAVSAPAFAAGPDDTSDEEDVDAEETEEEKKEREALEKARLETGDDVDFLDDEDELDKIDVGSDDEDGDEDDEGDLLGDAIDKDKIDQEGQDNSKLYREAVEDFGELAPDEEMLAWDRYLKDYPESLYKDRIESRQDDLEEMLYRERKSTEDDKRLDADQREVPISQGLLIENINPRTKILTGLEWGLPSYINLMADYEHAITREFSVHGGIRNRFQTWNLEFGARYAIVKSSRTQTLVTGILDFRGSLGPAYLAVRPQVAFGQRVGETLDFQVQVGIDQEMRGGSQLRVVGGGNVTARVDERVAVFLETNYNAKGFADDQVEGLYTFPVASFGIKLYPEIGGVDPGDFEINLGASIPYATRYYRWHEGSIMGQINLYL